VLAETFPVWLAALVAGALDDPAWVSPEVDPHAARDAHVATATKATLNLTDCIMDSFMFLPMPHKVSEAPMVTSVEALSRFGSIRSSVYLC
jgi:hypothetical protein